MATVRIPIACRSRDNTHSPPAPFLEAQLMFDGRLVGNKAFLVDTGADHTTCTSPALDMTPADFKSGKPMPMHGIGGAWPARSFFQRFTARVVDDAEGIAYDIPFPKIVFMSPYGIPTRKLDKSSGQPVLNEEWRRVPPSDRRLKTGRLISNPARENLLGRDFFIENGMHLVWNPASDSYIEFESA